MVTMAMVKGHIQNQIKTHCDLISMAVSKAMIFIKPYNSVSYSLFSVHIWQVAIFNLQLTFCNLQFEFVICYL